MKRLLSYEKHLFKISNTTQHAADTLAFLGMKHDLSPGGPTLRVLDAAPDDWSTPIISRVLALLSAYRVVDLAFILLENDDSPLFHHPRRPNFPKLTDVSIPVYRATFFLSLHVLIDIN